MINQMKRGLRQQEKELQVKEIFTSKKAFHLINITQLLDRK